MDVYYYVFPCMANAVEIKLNFAAKLHPSLYN